MSQSKAVAIIDTDSHITEPSDLWTSRMSTAKWGNMIPHVEWIEGNGGDSRQAWFIGEQRVSNQIGYSQFGIADDGAAVRIDGTAAEDVPQRYDRIHPSAFDVQERLKLMDAEHIAIQALYPNLLFFGYGGFSRSVDQEEFQIECVRAYNDFILEWISAAPERFIPLAFIPFWDVTASVKEIERCAEQGFRGIITTGAPHLHGQPYMADHHWDRLWGAAQAAQMPVSFHSGGGDQRAQDDTSSHLNSARIETEGRRSARARQTTCVFLDSAIHLTDLLHSGVLPRFPDLKFISVESGLGWIPFVLESADYHFESLNVRRERPEFEQLPSEYFHRQVYVNYWFEELNDWHLEKIGVGNILFETDYPHTTCIVFDEVAAAIDLGLRNVTDEVRNRILWKNASELFRMDLPQVATQ